MVMRAVICKGDPTSHGGVVMEGNPQVTANGRQVTQKGHMTCCPKCKGNFLITEGLSFHTYTGIGTVVEGMKAACGATLIATTTKGFMMIDDASDVGEAAGSAAHVNADNPAQAVAQNLGSFRAVDHDTGTPVPDLPYRIDLPDGTVLRGVTDADGYTQRVTGHDPAKVALHWEPGNRIEHV